MPIPSTHAEIEQLYIKAELSESRSICITSCQSGDGVTSLAIALTERYMLAGNTVLLIDLNLNKPSFNALEWFTEPNEQAPSITPEQWISHSSSLCCFRGLPVPTNPRALLAYKNPTNLSNQINEWLMHYDKVIIDTSPLLNINKGNVPAQVVASACDTTILSVLSSVTRKQQLIKSLSLLDSHQIHLLGTVMNAYHQPSLIDELCREVSRCTFLPNAWQAYLHNKIRTNPFLSIPI